MIISLNDKQKDQLWWLIITVDYTYERISIAEHELNEKGFTIWLEDKHDFKNSIEECLEITISRSQFAKFIKSENFNSYERDELTKNNTVKKVRTEVAEPITWYDEHASPVDQSLVRDALLQSMLTTLIENEVNTAA
jgi:hypothetical protein